MKGAKKIGALMHKLLIEKEMDGFSVIELRDASLLIEGLSFDLNEAHKMVYRQIFRFKKNNWLRCEGAGQKKRYFQTDNFKNLQEKLKSKNVDNLTVNSNYSVLSFECSQYKGELEIVLGEIEEYQSLRVRFPELESKLNPLLQSARERSALLLGKVNVLTNVINTLSKEQFPC
ncbi:hypothetical protein [Aliivibrio fischeri]|uniref:Transcriptional regulator VspR n=1 Tax=Aliivibrio fischeri TaxID=668 RepID=A0A844P693_ALIFS|nr:hypothetical protein [Aliivibrio fischeri]MUK50775.1 hypothetical protein [Aliivibrio fischeri]